MIPAPPGFKKTIHTVTAMEEESLEIKELLAFMKLHGLSIHELAEILGVTYQALKLWLDGKRDVSLTTTRLIRMFKKYPHLIREFGKC